MQKVRMAAQKLADFAGMQVIAHKRFKFLVRQGKAVHPLRELQHAVRARQRDFPHGLPIKQRLEFRNIEAGKALFFKMPHAEVPVEVLRQPLPKFPDRQFAYRMAYTDRNAVKIRPPGFVTRIASSSARFQSPGAYRWYIDPSVSTASKASSGNAPRFVASPCVAERFSSPFAFSRSVSRATPHK